MSPCVVTKPNNPSDQGHEFPVRRYRCRLPAQVPECDRRAQSSRLCQAIRVGRHCKAKDVVVVLEKLTSINPAPTFIRLDYEPEFNCFAEAQGLRPRSEEVVPEQRHQHCLHQTRITVAERLCRVVQQPVQG